LSPYGGSEKRIALLNDICFSPYFTIRTPLKPVDNYLPLARRSYSRARFVACNLIWVTDDVTSKMAVAENAACIVGSITAHRRAPLGRLGSEINHDATRAPDARRMSGHEGIAINQERPSFPATGSALMIAPNSARHEVLEMLG
jgi:hypothetical protein